MKLSSLTSTARVLAATALLCVTLPAAASNLPKAYGTGEQLPKPWQLSRLVEYTNARTPPVVDFTDLSGNKQNLSQFKGKFLMVNIWATWCAPCWKELPELEQMKQHFAGRDLAIQPISVDEVLTDVAPMLKQYNLSHVPTWLDTDNQIIEIMTKETVPATFFFDGNGNMVGFMRGYIDWLEPDVLEYVDGLISKYADPKFTN